MAFGQPSGPPASAKQVRELLELLHQAGHTDFRDARGPLGFNQRQAGGKFTRDEADELIEQLRAEADGAGPATGARTDTDATPHTPASADAPAARPKLSAVTSSSSPTPGSPATSPDRGLRSYPSEHLAAELQRRGWVVMEP